MLHPKDAESIILRLIQPLDPDHDIEHIGLDDASGRILSQDVVGQLDFPHWDNSAMDGYAVRFEDVKTASQANPVTLTLIDEIPAGQQPKQTVESHQAARIFTGAIVPKGADTIVIQEVTKREDTAVKVYEAPKADAFIRHQASYYRAGDPLLSMGMVVNAPEIAVLAAAQCSTVTVYRRPVVAILSTGDELVGIDQSLQPGQIVDSNRYALTTLIKSCGADVMNLGIIPDHPDALKKAIASALPMADMIISSGGVSVGDYDYVDQILETLGAEIHVRSVAVKPGKPLTVATFEPTSSRQNRCIYFGLPGNPVSSLVSFWRFVQPALMKLMGYLKQTHPMIVKGRSRNELRAGGKRETYLWGQVHLIDGYYEFELSKGSHSSGNLINVASMNALAIVPIGQTIIAPDHEVLIMIINSPRLG